LSITSNSDKTSTSGQNISNYMYIYANRFMDKLGPYSRHCDGLTHFKEPYEYTSLV